MEQVPSQAIGEMSVVHPPPPTPSSSVILPIPTEFLVPVLGMGKMGKW